MPVFKEIWTEVYCDKCRNEIATFRGTREGVSRDWAKYYARQKGCTTGKEIICKNCRISMRMKKCSLQKKRGEADKDGGLCLGFRSSNNELEELCKRCIAHVFFDWEKEKQRLSIGGRERRRSKRFGT